MRIRCRIGLPLAGYTKPENIAYETTSFARPIGKSRPNPATIQRLASRRKSVFPSGIAAANLLGFSTQTAKQNEVATSALSLPRKLVGSDTVIHTSRPEAWASLSESDAAILDFLRRAGRPSELSSEETIRRTIMLFSEKGRLERLLRIAATEPPRVRAMIGAIGEQLGKNRGVLRRLRHSLNPFSRFDFGMLAGLPSPGLSDRHQPETLIGIFRNPQLRHARDWQAKERR